MCETFNYFDVLYYFPGIVFSWFMAFKASIIIKKNYPFEEFIIKQDDLKFKGGTAKLVALFMIVGVVIILFFIPLTVFEIYKIKELGCLISS